MLSERASIAIETLRLIRPEVTPAMYTRASLAKNAPDFLRALATFSLEDRDCHLTIKHLWAAVSEEFLKAPAGTTPGHVDLMLQVLSDDDVFGAYREGVQEVVRENIMPTALRNERLQALAESVWKPSYEDDVASDLWRKAFAGYDLESAERLSERVSVEDVDFVRVMQGGVQLPVLRLFVSKLSDAALGRALEGVHAYLLTDEGTRKPGQPINNNCMVHLHELTQEHVRRHGLHDGMAKRFVEALCVPDEFRTSDLEDVVPEVARLAAAVHMVGTPGLTKLVYRHNDKFSPQEMGELIAGGLPLVREDLTGKQRGSAFKYLLARVEGESQIVVAKAMSDEQRRAYMEDESGFNWRLKSMAREWGELSAVDESVLTALRVAGYDFARKVPLYKGLDEMRDLHDLAYEGAEGRFLFVALHALGVYRKELRFESFGPLHYAASYNDVKAIDRLIALGHNVDDPADGWAGLMFAGRGMQSGWTPLMLAVKYGRADAVEALLAHGADAAFTSSSGHSPAKLAAAPLDKKATSFDKDRADKIKRVLRAARLGQKIEGAMGSEEKQPDASLKSSDAGIL